MATVNKIAISGVRSFQSTTEVVEKNKRKRIQTEQILSFEQPISIITGHNGAGKTSIIEALKFAITGSLPPGNKSFVLDPKLAGTPEVMGCVKLAFTACTGKKVMILRSFQLTNKAGGKQEFKKVENLLRTIEDGKEIVLSHQCANMDEALPQLFGISKAVLENIIFCHQEDSN